MSKIRNRRGDAGIALLISIFILLLISVVAIALIVSSGTESALAGNYRSSTGVYYAAVAGLEEARARLRPNDRNSFKNTAPGFLPPSGTPLAVCAPIYVTNPVGGVVVAPWDPANPFYDTEFGQEYAGICGAIPNPSPSTASVWNRSPLNGLPFPGPLYKWVRINGVTERSLNLDVSPHDTTIDPTSVYFDGAVLNDRANGAQVLELTALAVLPNGSQKLVQYLTAPVPIALPPFMAALTLSGSPNNSPFFQAPPFNSLYAVKGNDYDCSGVRTGSTFAAIGLFGNYGGSSYASDLNGIVNGIPTNASGTNTQMNYTGSGPAPPGTNPPDVEYLTTFPANLLSPGPIDVIAQTIIRNADATIPGGSNSVQTSFLTSLVSSGAMSSTNPLTVVANGDLDLTGWHNTGYGLLLVTGNLNYDPDASWNGIVMVVGQGTVTGSRSGWGVFNGAFLVARTRDASGNLLSGSNLGSSNVNFNNSSNPMEGYGINYSSCWIQRSQPTLGYKILSFHEIAQ